MLTRCSSLGENWIAINSGLSGSLRVYDLVVDTTTPSNLFVSISDGVFKSNNGGTGWLPSNSGLTGPIYQLLIDPVTSSTLYAGTGNGVFKSTDSGTHWIASNTGLTDPIQALAIDPTAPNTLYAGTYTVDGGRVFKSLDGGQRRFRHDTMGRRID